jgi:catechol 2,3-dioxygenase-like lactoylglutathione lyase family enzyme
MITAVHTLIYSDDPDATRAFLRDVLQLTSVGGDEWPIYRTGPSELGVHPTMSEQDGQAWTTGTHHEIALMCDDVAATRAELEDRGATFRGDTQDMGWGIGATVEVPGADGILIYQPRHEIAHS